MTDEPLPFVEDPDDVWLWWRTANEHPEWIGTPALPMHEGHPQTGLYRVRGKDSQWQRVQMWKNEFGVWEATRNGRAVAPDKVNDMWLWCCGAPVTEAAFERAERGEGWADEPVKAPGIGHNIDDADPHDALWIEYLGEAEAANEFLKAPIKTKDDADRASIWAKRLAGIATKADAHFKVEKQPSLDEGRRVEDRWRAVREEPAALSRKLKKHQTEWLQEQDRLEQQRVAAAQAEAARLRREAEEAEREVARKAREAERAVTRQEEIDLGAKIAKAKAAEVATEFRRPQAGRTGQKTSLRATNVAKIVDMGLLLASLTENAEIRVLAQAIANRAAKIDIALPGTEIVQQQSVV